MGRIFKMMCVVLMASGLSSCDKINETKLIGSWYESYDPQYFAMDSDLSYTFDGDGNYYFHVYDFLSNESRDYSGKYVTENNTITLIPNEDGRPGVTYNIVKLTWNEMKWQKKGTKYSKGTWGSDYRHFIRNK